MSASNRSAWRRVVGPVAAAFLTTALSEKAFAAESPTPAPPDAGTGQPAPPDASTGQDAATAEKAPDEIPKDRAEGVQCPAPYYWSGNACVPSPPAASEQTPSGLNSFGIACEVVSVPALAATWVSGSALVADAFEGGGHLTAPAWVAGISLPTTVLGLALAAGPGSEDSRGMVLTPSALVSVVGGVVEFYTGLGFLTVAAVTGHNHDLVAPGWVMTVGGPILAIVGVGLAVAAGDRHESALSTEAPNHRFHLALGPGPGQLGLSIGSLW
jgi:hypothetical protein